MVEGLFFDYGRYNIEFIQNLFLSHESEVILRIPKTLEELENFWCWHYDFKGLYTVKSVY